MRDERRDAAGIRVWATDDGVAVDGWCATELDPSIVTGNLRAELRITTLEPGDLVDDFDFVSMWCMPTGEPPGTGRALMAAVGSHVRGSKTRGGPPVVVSRRGPRSAVPPRTRGRRPRP